MALTEHQKTYSISHWCNLWGGIVSNPIAEARIAVEAAIAVAEIVSQTEIVQSTSFNQLITYLHDAREALAEVEGAGPSDPKHTILLTPDCE